MSRKFCGQVYPYEMEFFHHGVWATEPVPAGAIGEEQSMRKCITRFIRDESAATAIEYGLIAAGIAVAIIATVQALGTNLNSTFSTVSTSLK